MILIDSNILLDIFTDDPRWGSWSQEQIRYWGDREILAINPIIYAEISIGFNTEAQLEECLAQAPFERLPLPYEAGFIAGKSFKKYRQKEGQRTSPLPDFYIGAHATLTKMPLLSRDTSRYKTYFPQLKLIGP